MAAQVLIVVIIGLLCPYGAFKHFVGTAERKKTALNPIQVVGSVLMAGLGVQISKNRERDF